MTRAASALPIYATDGDLSPALFAPAGTDAEQLALHERLLSLLDIWHDGFGLRYRVRQSALRDRGWNVIMMPFESRDDAEEERVGAALGGRADELLGFGLGVHLPPGQVWRAKRVTPETAYMLRSALQHWTSVITAPDWPFLWMGDGNDHFAVLAGPESLLRAAFPDPAELWADFEADRAAEERMGRPRWLLDLVAHYAPFALRA